jgi:soluble lytic murein transglycosylase-like protein
MAPARIQMMIPLFGRMLRHSFVPAGHKATAARSFSPGRPLGRRASALPWTGASTVAGWRLLGIAMGIAAIVASLAGAANGATAAQMMPPSTPSTIDSHSDPFAGFVDEAAWRFAIPATWIHAVMRLESGGNPAAVSPKGAMGLMQIMPQTWADLCARYQLGADPFDPHDNIVAGAAYLRELYDRFGAAGFLAAYNAGPTRFEDYLRDLRPLREETTDYLTKLQAMLPTLQIGATTKAVVNVADWRRAGLFASSPAARPLPANGSFNQRAVTTSTPVLFALAPQSNGLFVHRDTSGVLP